MKKIFTLLTISVLTLSQVFSQWERSFGPEGYGLDQVISFDNKIHVVKSEHSGLFISEDAGDSWGESSFEEFKTKNVGFGLYNVDGNLFAYSISKLYKTDDNGKNWSLSNDGLVLPFHKIPVMSGFKDTLLICTEEEGIYRSTNGGVKWKKVGKNSLADKVTVHAVEKNGKIITAVESEGIMVSQTDSDDFVLKQSFSGDEKATSAAIAHGKAWVATTENLYSSDDNGSNWEKHEVGFPTNKLAVLEGELYSCSETGMYSISQNGTPSQVLDNGLETLDVRDVLKIDNKYFAATAIGVIRSTDKQNWGIANKNLGFTLIWSLAQMGDKYFMASNIGVWTSGSYGQRWVPLSFPGKKVYSLLAVNDTLYAALENAEDSIVTVYMTADKGKSWKQLGTPLTGAVEPELKMAGGHLYCHIPKDFFIDDGIYQLSSIEGDWNKVSASDGIAFNICNDKMYNGHQRGTLEAGGWETLTGDIESVVFHEFVVGPGGSGIIAGCHIMAPGDKPCYSSSDGLNFTAFSKGFDQYTRAMLHIVTKGDTTYAVTDIGQTNTYTYYTTKGASSWTKLGGNSLNELAENGRLFVGDRTKLMVTPYSIFLSSSRGDGLFRYDLQALPEVPDTVDQIEYPPLETALPSNISNTNEVKMYPNPVSNSLTIESIETIQSIRIYDLTGKTVKHSQVNGKRVTLDVSDLYIGMYLLEVQGQNGKQGIHKIIKQ